MKLYYVRETQLYELEYYSEKSILTGKFTSWEGRKFWPSWLRNSK